MAAEGKFLLPPLVYASSEKRIGQEKNFFRKCAVFNIHLIFADYTAIVKRENPRIKKPINLHFIYLQPQAAEGLCLSPLVFFRKIKQAGESLPVISSVRPLPCKADNRWLHWKFYTAFWWTWYRIPCVPAPSLHIRSRIFSAFGIPLFASSPALCG